MERLTKDDVERLRAFILSQLKLAARDPYLVSQALIFDYLRAADYLGTMGRMIDEDKNVFAFEGLKDAA